MSHKYLKAVKKFVSRKTAIERLKVTETQFNRLTVLSNVYPVVADTKNCYDRVDGWYYTIEDIKKIFYSETYEVLKENLKKSDRRERFLKVDQIVRADKICDMEFNFVDLIKQKYDSLGTSIEDLGNSLRHLYFIKMLELEEVSEDLDKFEKFVTEKKLLNKAFLSKKGIYFAFNIEKVMVVWMVPYPGTNLKDWIEEKVDLPTEAPVHEFDFLDFGSFSEDESEEITENVVTNDDNKFDIALLKYSCPLLRVHLKLVLCKLNALLESKESSKILFFEGKKFFIDVEGFEHWISFIISNAGGQLVSKDLADLIITESVDLVDHSKLYIQPQYVFDCLNKDECLPTDLYLVGMDLPQHISPFPNVMETIDSRSLKLLSNKKKYSILDRVETLN